MFYVGQEVVCINAGPDWEGLSVPLVEGQVYVVRSVEPFRPAAGCVGVNVVGVHLRPGEAFRVDRFRPLAKTDISVFTAMLNPAPKPERVNA